MKKMLLALGLVALTAAPALAVEKPIRLGLDFGMPYILTVDGNDPGQNRGNFNIGMDGRYWATDNINYGMRFAFDVEKQTGWYRMITLAPGVQYHWMPTESWQPFVRLDLPVVLMGAAHPTDDGKQDVGIAAGMGLAWNLGSAIGVENLSIRYDFDVNYLFGIGSSLPVLALDIFKIGFDYRF